MPLTEHHTSLILGWIPMAWGLGGSSQIHDCGREEVSTSCHCPDCYPRACQIHAASRIQLDMVLDTHRGCLFLLGLHSLIANWGRLQCWLPLPNKQVAPGSQSLKIVLSQWWCGLGVQQLRSYGECREATVHMLYNELRAPARRSCCHILLGNYRTEIVLLRIACSQLGTEVIGKLRCMFLTSCLDGPS